MRLSEPLGITRTFKHKTHKKLNTHYIVSCETLITGRVSRLFNHIGLMNINGTEGDDIGAAGQIDDAINGRRARSVASCFQRFKERPRVACWIVDLVLIKDT